MSEFVRRALTIVSALALLPGLAVAQEATFTGKVTSEGGAPIAAAQVFIDKMNVGTTSGDDGNYRFVVPAARAQGQQVTLTAQVIGYKPQSTTVTLTAGPQTHDFTLVAVPTVLSQVVVTGEGTVTTEAKLGNRVDKVVAQDIIKSNESNVSEALAAKAPNVEVQSQSGDPGGSVSVQIRGLKSFSGDGQPLYVVDGVPIDNQTRTTFGASQGTNEADGNTVAPNRISATSTPTPTSPSRWTSTASSRSSARSMSSSSPSSSCRGADSPRASGPSCKSAHAWIAR